MAQVAACDEPSVPCRGLHGALLESGADFITVLQPCVLNQLVGIVLVVLMPIAAVLVAALAVVLVLFLFILA